MFDLVNLRYVLRVRVCGTQSAMDTRLDVLFLHDIYLVYASILLRDFRGLMPVTAAPVI